MDNPTISKQNPHVVGVVCEFNPFHLGHAWLLQQIRERLGEDTVILCAMSGDFVQRGEPAIFSKYARAEAACLCGADLVAELPPRVSLSSAEGFAAGAVELLENLGADTIAFGAETEEAGAMMRLAEGLRADAFNEAVRQNLQREPNQSYAAAREVSAGELWGKDAELLEKPNCILGIEYCKAILSSGRGTAICVIPRSGAGHDEESETGFKSGAQLRELMRHGEDVSEFIPGAMQRVLEREKAAGRGPVSPDALEQAALARLRMMGPEAMERLPDAANGLGTRVLQAAHAAGTLEELYETAKSKRFALSRVRRVCWQAVLGLNLKVPEDGLVMEPETTGGNGDYAASQPLAACARVLALSKRGRMHLKRGTITVPVIVKTADAAKSNAQSEQMIAECAHAHDLWVLALPSPEARRGGEDFRKGPFIIEDDNNLT